MDNYCKPIAAILRKAQGVVDSETGSAIDVGGECVELRQMFDRLRAENADLRFDLFKARARYTDNLLALSAEHARQMMAAASAAKEDT